MAHVSGGVGGGATGERVDSPFGDYCANGTFLVVGVDVESDGFGGNFDRDVCLG